MPEDQRECKKCGFSWYARHVRPSSKVTRLDGWDGMVVSGAARVGRKAAKRAETLAANNRWAMCPRCGSRRVRTVLFRRVDPLGGEQRQSHHAEVADRVISGELLPIGSRVVLDVLGLRGKIGTISAITEHGYTVKLDGGGTARRVATSKVKPADS